MTDPDDPEVRPGGADGAAGTTGEPVGSVGEEAAKLFGALSDWAREQGSESIDNAAGAAHHLAQAVGEVGEHVATGGEDCRYCPLCQAIHVVRQTSPEVRAHLAQAASSLMQAASGLLATRPGHPAGRATAGVEKIDLDDDDDDDDSDWDEDR